MSLISCFADFLVLLFLTHSIYAEEDVVVEKQEEEAQAAGFMGMNPMMDHMMGMGMGMNQMMDPMMMGMNGMNPMMMDPMMGMNGMNQMMMDPMMSMGMNQMMMGQMGMNPMMNNPMMMDPMMMGMNGMNPMMNQMGMMYSVDTEGEEEKTDVDSAQFMMMPMGGGGCANTCGCRQRCKMMFWLPCKNFYLKNFLKYLFGSFLGPCPPCNNCPCCDSGNGSSTNGPPADPEPPTTTTTGKKIH